MPDFEIETQNIPMINSVQGGNRKSFERIEPDLFIISSSEQVEKIMDTCLKTDKNGDFIKKTRWADDKEKNMEIEALNSKLDHLETVLTILETRINKIEVLMDRIENMEFTAKENSTTIPSQKKFSLPYMFRMFINDADKKPAK